MCNGKSLEMLEDRVQDPSLVLVFHLLAGLNGKRRTARDAARGLEKMTSGIESPLEPTHNCVNTPKATNINTNISQAVFEFKCLPS